MKAIDLPEPLATEQVVVHGDVDGAIRWIAQRSAEEVYTENEEMRQWLLARDRELRDSGDARKWVGGVQVSQGANGPLAIELAKRFGFSQVDVCDVLRSGYPMVGPLPS